MTFFTKYYIKLYLLFFMCSSALSQEGYQMVWFSADSNHLPQNSVKAIAPDKYGYIWLSTENGIVRYDGQNFEVFNAQNVKGLESNRMMLFTGNIKNDSIFILNERNGMVLINQRSAQRLQKLKRPAAMLKSMEMGTYKRHPAVAFAWKDKPFAIAVNNDTYLLDKGKVNIYDNSFKLKRQFKYTYKDSSRFFACGEKLYHLQKNYLYTVCTEQPAVPKSFDRPFASNSKLYTNTLAQQTFIYANRQLYFIKEKQGQLITESILNNFDCEANNIVSAYYDEYKKILFLGSTNRGLLMVKHKIFSHNVTPYHHSSGTDDVYYALAKYNSNSILASTGEIFGTKGETDIINIGKYTDKYMLVIDDLGNVWTKKGNWLYRFNKKDNFEEPDKWEFDYAVGAITKGVKGNIFVGIFDTSGKKGGLLYTIDPKKELLSPALLFKTDFAPSELKAIDENTLWGGSWSGLYKIYLDRKKAVLIKGFKGSFVRSIYTPTPTETWVCTYNNGFYLYKDNKITHMPTDRNRYLLSTHCILEDRQGFMWMTTNKGLFVAKKQDLYNYAANKKTKVYYHAYEKKSGFLNNEFNGGCNPCGVNLDNKTLFFPSMDGVVYFDPEKVSKNQPGNSIFLDQTEVDSITFSSPDKLTFHRDFGKIKFYLSSPFYGNPYNLTIETRLEGPVVQDWTPMTENNVSFSTLPPGEYTLKARKLNGFGSQYTIKDFKFCITPAFWQTGWFTIVLIVLGIYSIYLIYKLRVRYIKHKNIQLEKQVVLKTHQLQDTISALRKTKEDLSTQVYNHKNLIKTITHDIKSPLRFIAITGRFMYNSMNKQEALSKDDIKAVYTSSSQLYHFVDNFLEYAKETDLDSNESDPYSLHQLVDEKAEFFKNISAAAKTTVINNTDKDLLISVNRHLLSITLHNLLDNALKNTFNGSITIHTLITDQDLSIVVADTGYGMKPDMVSHYTELAEGRNSQGKQKGMGLQMIIELLVILSGSLTIKSEENKGTEIRIIFKRND